MKQTFKNIIILLVIQGLITNIVLAQRNPSKKRSKHSESEEQDEIESFFEGFSDVLEQFTQHPDQLDQMSTKYSIQINEQIIQGTIFEHLNDYYEAVASDNGLEYLDVEDMEILDVEEAQQYLDKVIYAIFNQTGISGKIDFENVVNQKEFTGKKVSLNNIGQSIEQQREKIASDLVKLYRNLTFKQIGSENDKLYNDKLDQVINKLVDYYVNERGVDREEIEQIYKFKNGMDNASTWAGKYLSNGDFQSALDEFFPKDLQNNSNIQDSLQDILENPEKFDKLFSSEDMQNLSKQAHDIAQQANIDTQQVDYMLEKYQEEQRQKQQEKLLREREEENKKHDGSILLILGILVGSVVICCVLRYLRQKKLERDAYTNQAGYHQNL